MSVYDIRELETAAELGANDRDNSANWPEGNKTIAT